MIELDINGKVQQVEVPEGMPLLWVLRDTLGMTGTKFGCGATLCGACTVHLDGEPTRTCMFPASMAVGHKITTIEGLNHAVQQAWVAHQVPQCGYCQSGQLMVAAALLDKNPHPTDAEIEAGMPNLCRCTTYARMREAIRAVAASLPAAPAAPAAPTAPTATGGQ